MFCQIEFLETFAVKVPNLVIVILMMIIKKIMIIMIITIIINKKEILHGSPSREPLHIVYNPSSHIKVNLSNQQLLLPLML